MNEFWRWLGAMARRGPDGHPLAVSSVTLLGAAYLGLLAFIPLLHALGEPTVAGAGRDPSTGLLLLMLPLSCTWVGDAAAFFAGTAWGRRKMAPTISPNKSWVGFWANVVGAAVAASLWGLLALPRLPAFSDSPIAACLRPVVPLMSWCSILILSPPATWSACTICRRGKNG